jgi:hypothetical protein
MDRPAITSPRSPESLAFEDFWRSMRGDALLPGRRDFHPGKAARFLKDMVLMEAPSLPRSAGRIRVTGDRFNDIAGGNWTGRDDIDLFPSRYQADAVASRHLMIEKPCGLWQISPAHLSKGYAVDLEITVFPLAPAGGDTFFLLCQVLAMPGISGARLPAHNGMMLDTASAFAFLDIGAGEPVWADAA